MKKRTLMMSALAMTAALAANSQNEFKNLDDELKQDFNFGSTGYNPIYNTNPIYFPKKHTIESYRSQQRKAKQRRKSKNK